MDLDLNGAINETINEIDALLGTLADLGLVEECWAMRRAIEKIMPGGL